MQVVTVWMSERGHFISLCLNKRKNQGSTSQLRVILFFCAKFAHAPYLLFKNLWKVVYTAQFW